MTDPATSSRLALAGAVLEMAALARARGIDLPAGLVVDVERVRAMVAAEKGYNPDQPRWPAGDERGGQWRPASVQTALARWEEAREQEEAGGPDTGEITVSYDEYAEGNTERAMAHFGLTEADMMDMFALPGHKTEIALISDEDPVSQPGFTVKVIWSDSATGSEIGKCDRSFTVMDGKLVCLNDEMKFEPYFQDAGLARSIYERQIKVLAERSKVEAVRMTADISIGRYAWAKMGFQYSTKDFEQGASSQFRLWAIGKGITEPPGGWPAFRSPQDVANYRIPGLKVPTDAIINPDLKPGDYEVGKAFMLDDAEKNYGHGSWSAVLWLKKS